MLIHRRLCALLTLKVFRIGALATFRWCHIDSMLAVRQNPMKSRQIGSGFRHQSGQLGNEVQRLEYDVRCPNSIRGLQFVPNHT